jgi:hypothetical protein
MDRYNKEGYPDPTAYEALTAVAKSETVRQYRPLVYVASPFAGDTESNIVRAQGFCRFAISKGCIPIAPHLHYPQFLDDGDKEQRELGLFFALVLLGKCDELWVFGDKISTGMAAEIAKAKKRGMLIKYFNHKCEVLEYGT